MKTRLTNSSLILILAACGIIFFAGCASMETGNTTSLLSAAGFRTRTPQTAKQKEIYAALPSNKLEHATVKGKGFYVFKDEKAGVAYIAWVKAEIDETLFRRILVNRTIVQTLTESKVT